MTFNIRYGRANDGENSWEYRKNLVFDVIRDSECDFIGMQEAMVFQIEEILEQIENGELDVDQLAEKVKQASVLLKICRGKLFDTEKEIERILKEMDNGVAPDENL